MCMVSQDKLIKNGIRYTDKLFDEISRRLEKGVLDSDTLEEFLRKTKEYTTNNPLVSTDYDKTMINIILAETNNHKFSRPAQKELVRVTIENKVGDLIRDVGEDIKQSVRDIVTEEYNNPEGSNPQKMAKQISKKVSGIKNKRAKTIARTEIARTATISDYIIASERGATHYTVTCRSTRCPICKKMYCKSSETGGDVEYSMEDTSNLPPLHPNCRCSANFYKKKGAENTTNEEITTKSSTRPYNLNGGERHSNVEITQGVLDKIIQHQEKRATAKIEWGNTVDLKTGKLNLTEDVKGKKNQVTVPRPSTGNYGLLHNHPLELPFSGGDMFNQLGYRNQNVCVATTPKGVWVARDTEFGAASKVKGLSDNTRYEIKYKMDGKYREFSRETLDKKYAERMRNATTRKEYNAIKKEYLADPEYKEKYAKWLLEEYGVGVNKYNYFEIEFIPKEELKNVRF